MAWPIWYLYQVLLQVRFQCCSDTESVKPATKNLVFKNLLGSNLPVRPIYAENLFSLKFETGSCFLKSIKKKRLCTLGQTRLVNIQNPLAT